MRFQFKVSLVVCLISLFSVAYAEHVLASQIRESFYDDDTSIDFVFLSAEGNPDHYNVYLSVDGEEYSLVGVTENTSYTVAGEHGHTYRLKVQAVDAAGNTGLMSDESDPVTVILPIINASVDVSYVKKVERAVAVSRASPRVRGERGGASVNSLPRLADRNGFVYAVAVVTVVDNNENRVSGVVVTGDWSGVLTGTEGGETGSDGTVSFESDIVRAPVERALHYAFSDSDFVFTVTNVSHPDYKWDGNQASDTEVYISKSALLANFPNPCILDTWIPFVLKDPSNVVIRIYSATGRVVRILRIGYKEAGRYRTREKAAYWDGKNICSERVANGIYFYEIQAGLFRAIKKMVVIK